MAVACGWEGMSAAERKYALCHVCPRQWIRNDTIPAGMTAEEACAGHNEEELAHHFKNKLIWDADRLLTLRKARKKA